MRSDRLADILEACGYYISVLWERILSFTKTAASETIAFIKRVFPIVMRKLWEKTYRTTRYITYGVGIFIKKKGARSAAQFSFFILMTLFPLLICVHWFLATILVSLHSDASSILGMFSDVMPASVYGTFNAYLGYISEKHDEPILVAALIMLVTPSAAAFRALRGILCDIRNRTEKNGTLMFILSFFVSVVMLLIIYVSMVLLFTGSRLLKFLVNRFHLSESILGWNWIRFLLLFVMLYILLYVMYRFAHIDLMNPREVLEGKAYPGAVICSFLMVGVSILYSWFINLSTNYSLVYGSLASLIILMLWMYTCSNIIIMGGVVNRVVNEREALRRRFKVPKDVHAAAENAQRSLRIAIYSVEKKGKKKHNGRKR